MGRQHDRQRQLVDDGLTGTFTPPAGADPATLQVYIGSGPHSSGAARTPTSSTTSQDHHGRPAGPPAGVVLETDFEDGLDGWVPRGDAQGNPTVEVTGAEAHGGTQAALVSEPHLKGDGIGHDVTGIMVPGVTYEITAWVQVRRRAGDGGDLAEHAARQRRGIVVRHGGADSRRHRRSVAPGTARYLMPSADTAFLYFETRARAEHRRASSSTTSWSTALDASGHRGPHADQGHGRLQHRRRRSTRARPPARPPRCCLPALRPGDAGEPHEAGGLVRRGADVRDPSRGDRDHGLRPGQRPRGVRPHAGLAQPDAGLVLPDATTAHR